jgi:VWFA-related protein
LAPQTRRTFLFVLGFGRIQHPTRAVDGVIEFVRDKLLPQDLAAVLAFDRATDFTTDHAQLLAMLERYRAQHEKVWFDVTEFVRRVPFGVPVPPLPKWIHDEVDAIFTGVAAPGKGEPAGAAISAAPMRSATDMLLGMNPLTAPTDKPGDASFTYDEVREAVYRFSNIPLTDAVLRGGLLKVYAGIEYLRYLDGEKHLVYLGNSITGFSATGSRNASGIWSTEDDARLARRASDARVVLDIIQTSGQPPRSGLSSKGDFASRVQDGRIVTDLTGGAFTSVQYANDALASIDRRTRFSYLLGYTPASPAQDGRFRQVEVRVSRPGVKVLYQHGYYAVDEIPPLELESIMTASRIDMAAGIAQEAGSIKVRAEAVLLPRFGIRFAARVDVTIDASQLAWTSAGGTRTASLELRVYAGDARENVIGETGRRLDLSGDEATYAGWLKNGIRQSARVDVTERPQHIKVVVYDYGSDRIGSAMVVVR